MTQRDSGGCPGATRGCSGNGLGGGIQSSVVVEGPRAQWLAGLGAISGILGSVVAFWLCPLPSPDSTFVPAMLWVARCTVTVLTFCCLSARVRSCRSPGGALRVYTLLSGRVSIMVPDEPGWQEILSSHAWFCLCSGKYILLHYPEYFSSS